MLCSCLTEGRNKHKRRTVFARFINGLRQTGDELNPNEGMQLKVKTNTLKLKQLKDNVNKNAKKYK